MGFVTSHFGKMKLWPVEHFYNIFVLTFVSDCYCIQQSRPKGQSFIFPKWLCYKIHTLAVLLSKFKNIRSKLFAVYRTSNFWWAVLKLIEWNYYLCLQSWKQIYGYPPAPWWVCKSKVLGQFEHDKDIGTIVHWGAERVWEFLVQAWQIG